jgi:hypothetical protein|mmetsp:Transcript_28853/g.49155  ORF Transcript_28853/g.49155 Transcript_28853/m.49155 type:complete len:103 (+) Transcript_28853:3122-3430(+)
MSTVNEVPSGPSAALQHRSAGVGPTGFGVCVMCVAAAHRTTRCDWAHTVDRAICTVNEVNGPLVQNIVLSCNALDVWSTSSTAAGKICFYGCTRACAKMFWV